MKRVIRKSTFETNSSSAHAFTFKTKDDNRYDLCKQKLTQVKDNYSKLLVLIGACQFDLYERRQSLIYWFEENSRDEEDAAPYDIVDDIVDNGTVDFAVNALMNWQYFYDDVFNNERLLYNEIHKALNCQTTDEKAFFEWYVQDDENFNGILHARDTFEEVLDAYCKYTGDEKNVLKQKLGDLVDFGSEPICCQIFDETPLDDCNCGIDNLFDFLPNYGSISGLVDAVMTDKLSVFCCERWYSAYCSIDDILDGID